MFLAGNWFACNIFFISILIAAQPDIGTLGIIITVALIMFFSFFYTAIVFNSDDTAENLRKNGAYVPGRRPGKNTAEYFDYLLMYHGLYLLQNCLRPNFC